ncbi:MAG: secondary thiamine-phosphate synthase enzyme YjbQ [Patescibacteria group bacterium]
MKTIIIKSTEHKQVIDITDLINKDLNKKDSICHLSLKHTTCALTTADLDPGTDLDLLDFLEKIIPKLNFRHPHNPKHTPDHILSSFIGTSITLPVKNGKLLLGSWQRVILIEFNGPRQRELVIF